MARKSDSAATPPIDHEAIRELAKLLDETGLTEIALTAYRYASHGIPAPLSGARGQLSRRSQRRALSLPCRPRSIRRSTLA